MKEDGGGSEVSSRVHVRTLQINSRGKARQNMHTSRNSVQNSVLHVKLLAGAYKGERVEVWALVVEQGMT